MSAPQEPWPITLFCQECEREQGVFDTPEDLKACLQKRFGVDDYETEEGDNGIYAYISCGTCHKYGAYCQEC